MAKNDKNVNRTDNCKENEGQNLIPKNIPKSLRILLPARFYEILGRKPVIVFNDDTYPHYQPGNNKIYLNKYDNKFEYYLQTMYTHELGHLLHTTKEIIYDDYIDNKFKVMVYDNFYYDFEHLPEHIKTSLFDANRGGMERLTRKRTHEIINLICDGFRIDEYIIKSTILCDVVEVLTLGRYGFGHGKSYYRGANKSFGYDELFAHCISMYFMGNELVEYYFPNGWAGMKKYLNSLFKLRN